MSKAPDLDPRSSTVRPDLLILATDYLTALAFDRPLPDIPVDPDWLPAIREASAIHGLGPFLGLRIQAGEIDPPEPIRGWLAHQVERNRERLSRMRAELLLTLDILTERGFAPLPVKGAALLLDSVESVLWRSYSDIDLLVPVPTGRRMDLSLAFARAGYCLKHVSWKHCRYTSCAPGPPLVIGDGEHPDNPRDIESHDAVVEMFRGFRWDLTSHLLSGHVERSGHPIPSDRAMALHLAVHASTSALEGTARAINLVDLARALDRSGALPVYLATRDAGLNRHARFVYPAVALAARETGNPACLELRDRLAPFVPPAMAAWSSAVSLFHVSWASRHDRAALDRHTLWAHDSRDRVRMLAHTLLPSPAVIASERDAAGPRELARSYARHYRSLVSRLAAS